MLLTVSLKHEIEPGQTHALEAWTLEWPSLIQSVWLGSTSGHGNNVSIRNAWARLRTY